MAKRFLFLAAAIVLTVAATANAQISRVGVTFYAIAQNTRGTAIAFGSDVYLAVSTFGVLRGRLISADGNPLGAEFPIQSSGNFTHFPRVAYSADANGGAGAFLVTWHETDAGDNTPTSVHSRLVSPAGALLGAEQKLSPNESWFEAGPPVAYSTGSKEFLVVWRSITPNDIRAIRVGITGAPIGAAFAISATGAAAFEDHTSVAYSQDTNEFMVLYGSYTTYSTLYSQRVKAGTGALVAGPATVHTAGAIFVTEIQYNRFSGTYQAAWYQDPPKAVYGVTLTSAGAPTGDIKALSSRFRAYDALSMAFNPISQTSFLISHDSITSEDGGVEVNGDGTPLTTGVQVTVGGGTGNFYPRVATHTGRKEFMAVAANSFTSTIAQRFKTDTGGSSTPPPATPPPPPAVTYAAINSPAAGSTLTGTTQTFSWSTGTANAPAYWLNVGRTQGGYEIFSNYVGASTSYPISGLPTTGGAVWVRLMSYINGSWSVYADYQYTAATLASPARLTSPAAGTKLASASQTFTWSPGTGVSFYWVNVGTSQGGYNLYSNFVGQSLSLTLNNLPTAGEPVWVRLQSYINGAYTFIDYSFTAATLATPAAMVTPTPGVELGGAVQGFNWTPGTNVTAYWLDVGTNFGGYDLYSNYQAGSLSAVVRDLPPGKVIYVRLLSLINGSWAFRDYQYTTAGFANPARMVSPTPGAQLEWAVQGFNWSPGTNATAYWLDIGTNFGGYDIWSNYHSWTTSAVVSYLPPNKVIYVRLFSLINGSWIFRDYTYTTGSVKAAQLTSHTAGATLTGSTVTFQWSSGLGVTSYWLDVGSVRGGAEYYSNFQDKWRLRTVSGLPRNGGQLWVRLWSLINGSWAFVDMPLTAAAQ